MQTTRVAALTDSTGLNDELAVLAAVEPSDAPFLSCYIDMRQGREACMAYLQRKISAIGAPLHGVSRIDLDVAAEMVLREVESRWTAHAAGMAVFARSLAGGRHLSVLQFASAFDNRVVWYRAPEILLLALAQHAPPTRVLLARGDSLELMDFELGLARSHAWAQAPLLANGPARNGAGVSAPQLISDDRSLHAMRRHVASGEAPLLLAGDVPVMRALADWLPVRAASRLIGSIALSARLQGDTAVTAVREQIHAMHADQALQMVNRLLLRMRRHGSAAAGQIAAFEALRAGSADVLLVVDRCGGESASGPTASWDPLIELPRLAFERGARVVVSDADALRYLGGVACLLHGPEEHDAMPLPPVAQHLDLVA